MLLLVEAFHLVLVVVIGDEVVSLALTKHFSKWLVLFLQILQVALLLLHQLKDELTKSSSTFIKQ